MKQLLTIILLIASLWSQAQSHKEYKLLYKEAKKDSITAISVLDDSSFFILYYPDFIVSILHSDAVKFKSPETTIFFITNVQGDYYILPHHNKAYKQLLISFNKYKFYKRPLIDSL